MSRLRVLSDQLLQWSAPNDQSVLFCPQTAPQEALARAASTGLGPARLAHRALQTLRQTRVQMRRGSRARSQVLSVGKFSGQSTTDGLRPAGRSRRDQRTTRQLSSDPRDLRGHLRDQPRTAAASRGAVRSFGELGVDLAHHPHRFAVWRRAAGQHARGLVRSRARVAAYRGGQQ
jgi:hypothetical protein